MRHERAVGQRLAADSWSTENPTLPSPLTDGSHICDVPETPTSSEMRTRASALGWNRTSDLRFRKPTLYPLSYEGGRYIIAGQRPVHLDGDAGRACTAVIDLGTVREVLPRPTLPIERVSVPR